MHNLSDENICNSSVESDFYQTESIITEQEVDNKIKTYSYGRFPKIKSQIEVSEDINEKIDINTNNQIIDKLTILCLTWNLCGNSADKSVLKDLIPSNRQYDIYAIGTQECMRSILASFLYTNKSSWENLVEEYLGKDYFLLKSENLNATHLMIFIHSRIADCINHLGSNTIKTGFYNMTGNKGAVSVWFRYKETSFIFINCHLESGHDAIKKRNANFERILRNMNFFNMEELRNKNSSSSQISDYDKEPELTLNFDFSFVMGDFNYRIDGDLAYVSSCLKQNRLDELLNHDQLRNQIASGELRLKKFSEGEIKFPPTYKFYVGTNIYNYTEGKIPGWLDRIIINDNIPQFLRNKFNMKLLEYNSIANITLSDHKPVKAEFELSIEEKEDDYFNRNMEEDTNIYNNLKRYSSSSVDSMQLYRCMIF